MPDKQDSVDTASIERPKRILVIDDNPEIHNDYHRILDSAPTTSELEFVESFLGAVDNEQHHQDADSELMQVDSAFQGQEALEKVVAAAKEGWPYSMAFVDMRMPPGWDGLQTVEELWKVCPDLQVVICTAYSDNSWEDIIVRLGRTDKLLILKKPFDRVEVSQLAVALTEKWELTRKAEFKQRDLERLVEERTKELKKAALHDPLTGLPNRKLFEMRLKDTIRRVERHNRNAAVILIDLDNFKTVNDTLGHPAGDDLLNSVASRLLSCVRETDTVARLGGDEFAVIWNDLADDLTAETQMQRIIDVVGAPLKIQEHKVTCGVSMGVAMMPLDGLNPIELMRKADLALYRAKRNGRGQYRLFDERMDAEVTAIRRIESDLRQAVASEEFMMYYQPIVDRQGRVCTFEALIRWRHPERGILFPIDFLDVAESTGAIVPIGEWVLRTSCLEAVKWPEHIRVAVNVSPSQFACRTPLSQHVTAALSESGLDPRRLELEITEQVLLRELPEITAELDTLRNMGVSIVLDDFGVGFSSLSYLSRFPFDRIKLDRTFFDGESETNSAVVRAVAGLGRNLGLQTTAEGVETRAQMDTVLENGFSCIQGYYFGKPTPADELTPFYTTQHHDSACSHGVILPAVETLNTTSPSI